MSESTPALSANGLTKHYGSTTAVEDLDLQIPRGVVYGFLGPNGAGKTTTMQLLCGLIDPTDGEAHVAGTPCTERRELVERIGLLPEEPPLYDELTGREQLQFAADLRNVRWDDIADRALELCEELDLVTDLDRRIGGYSTGMQTKTAFVQAVQHDPEVLFLDEPTSGLDPRAARTLRERIVDIADDDATVFLSTHILPVVEAVADRIGVLHDGRLVATGSPDDLAGNGEHTGGERSLEDAFLQLTSEESATPPN
ncbi:MAG: ABC transporter ATP-binding protein [Halococcoides sp.]